MKHYIAIGALLVAASPALAVDRLKSIPPAFHGDWNTSLASCHSNRGDGNLTIAAKKISFYESSGPVRTVLIEGPTEIIVVAHLSGEGDRRLERIHFRLSSDHNTILDVSQGEPFARYRCPGRAK